MTTLLIILACVLLFVFIVKPYFQRYDTVLLYTGGLGSGKSLVSGQMALRLLRKNRNKVKWHNRFQRFKKPEKRSFQSVPQMYTSIPFRISRKEWAHTLSPDTPILVESIPEKSVVWLDEVSLYIDQMTMKYVNADNLEEFITLFRHYTKGGYLVINTQSSNKTNFHIRYAVNATLNLYDFHKILFFYWVKCRNITLSEDIKTIEEGNKEENYSTLFGFLPLFCKHYDTYAYSERYRSVPRQRDDNPDGFKAYSLCRKPSEKKPALTTDDPPSPHSLLTEQGAKRSEADGKGGCRRGRVRRRGGN